MKNSYFKSKFFFSFNQKIAENKLNKGSFGFDVAPNRARNLSAARTYKLGAIAVTYFDGVRRRRQNLPMTISSK